MGKSKFSADLWDECLGHLACGGWTHNIPDVAKSTFFYWLKNKPELMDSYLRAREAGTYAIADECIAIADDDAKDTLQIKDKRGEVVGEKPNTEWIARSKVRYEARKWLCEKFNPKRFGKDPDTVQDLANAVVKGFIEVRAKQNAQSD
jgi:hypothetical protein